MAAKSAQNKQLPDSTCEVTPLDVNPVESQWCMLCSDVPRFNEILMTKQAPKIVTHLPAI